MTRRVFIRNVRARDQLELFLVSAIASLLLLRFFLHIAGYPQVGGGTLHIAHMLWGGMLMLAAIMLCLGFIGRRIERLAALIGGIGFGIFIDEIGKFLTKDNNYFFRPAVGIIYAIFVLIYLSINFFASRQKFSHTEFQLNAILQLEEAVMHDMDQREKSEVLHLLARADQNNEITIRLKELLHSIDAKKLSKPSWIEKTFKGVDRAYSNIWKKQSSNHAVRIFFLIEVSLFLLGVIFSAYDNLEDIRSFFTGQTDYGHSLIIGQFVSTILAMTFAIIGAIKLAESRSQAFEWFKRATITNLLLTEFFLFSRIQFGAMPSFIFNLVLLGLISFALTQENRNSKTKKYFA